MTSYLNRKFKTTAIGQIVVSKGKQYAISHVHNAEKIELVPDITVNLIHKGKILSNTSKFLGKCWEHVDD